MSPARTLWRVGVAGLVLLTAFLVLELTHKANAAYASRNKAGVAEPAKALAWRQTLYFDHPAAPRSVLVEGWSAPQPGSGAWSDAPRAVLKLPPAPAPGPADVALKVEVFIAPGRPFQRVTARAGGRALGEWRLTKAEATTLRFQVPDGLRTPAGDLAVQLDLPDATSPAGRVEGALDPRLLAIRLREVTIAG